MNIPHGKGLYVWYVREQPVDWVDQFLEMELTWIAVKIADGTSSFNLRPLADGGYADDILGPFVTTAKAAGFDVYGWQYIYGFNPIDEAEKAVQRMLKFDLAGFIIDAEKHYKYKPNQATLYSNHLKKMLPDTSIALSTYRFPEIHQEFPFQEFLRVCHYNAPQVYWNEGKAGKELRLSHKQYSKFTNLPMIPAGRAYEGEGFPRPTPAEVDDFLTTAKDMGQTGAFFWSADALFHRLNPLPEIVNAIADWEWEDIPLPPTKKVKLLTLDIQIADSVYYTDDEIPFTKRSEP